MRGPRLWHRVLGRGLCGPQVPGSLHGRLTIPPVDRPHHLQLLQQVYHLLVDQRYRTTTTPSTAVMGYLDSGAKIQCHIFQNNRGRIGNLPCFRIESVSPDFWHGAIAIGFICPVALIAQVIAQVIWNMCSWNVAFESRLPIITALKPYPT